MGREEKIGEEGRQIISLGFVIVFPKDTSRNSGMKTLN
jgi:hypothetical protein